MVMADNLTPRDIEIIGYVLAGKTQREIGAIMGVTGQAIGQQVNKPHVKEEISRRLSVVADKIIQFKLHAIDGAMLGLNKIIQLSTSAKTEELQRLASMDTIKVSGLMPRKRVLVETSQVHGIDDDTKEFIQS